METARVKKKSKKKRQGKDRSKGRQDKRYLKVCESAQYLALNELRNHPKQIRVLDDKGWADLRFSLMNNGLYHPLLAFKEKGKKGAVILGGNQRLRVMRHLVENEQMSIAGPGGDRIPVTWFKGTPEQAELVVLRDNLHAADWDYLGLGEHLQELKNRGQDPVEAGFDEADVADLLALANQAPEIPDAKGAPKEPSLGRFKVYRFKVPKGDEAQLVDDALAKVGGEEYEPIVRLARMALEHGDA